MKTCVICKENKSLDCFNVKKKNKDGIQDICKDCSRARSRQYYYQNKERHVKVITERKNKHIAKVKKLKIYVKELNGCQICNEPALCCIDFHHVVDKDFELGYARSKSINRVLKELSKCICLCSNCHRKVHFGLIKLDQTVRCKLPDEAFITQLVE